MCVCLQIKLDINSRQYRMDTSQRQGIKLWVLRFAVTGYFYYFGLCVRKKDNNGPFGLAYELIKTLLMQRFSLYFNNFTQGYTYLWKC